MGEFIGVLIAVAVIGVISADPLMVYLSRRYPRVQTRRPVQVEMPVNHAPSCPACGRLVHATDTYCADCGQQIGTGCQ